jgi:hypothetical protein
MSAKTVHLVLAFLAIFAIFSTASASPFLERLSGLAKRHGYNEKLVKKRVAGEVQAAPNLRDRATAAPTSSVCTTAYPPNPTKP